MSKRTRKITYDFRGKHAVQDVGSATDAPIVTNKTAAAGSPTLDAVNGILTLALDSQNEVQNLCAYMGDEYPFDIDDLIRVEFLAKVSASLASSVQVAFGVTSARNDAIDSIAEAALFRCVGNNNLLVETDDGTNDNDDKDTGLTFENSWKSFAIDFATGVQSVSPGPSKGGKAAVQFFAGNKANNSLRSILKGTLFDMSNYSGTLQLFAQIQKTAGTATGTLEIAEMAVEFKLPG